MLPRRPIHFITTLYDASVHWEVVEYAEHLCASHRRRLRGQSAPGRPDDVKFHCLRALCCHAPYYEVPQIYNRLLGSLLRPTSHSWLTQATPKKHLVGLVVAGLSVLGACAVAFRRRAS